MARLNAKAASGKKLSDLEDTILRGQAAQQNGFEWWGVWAVAVVRDSIELIISWKMNEANENLIGDWLFDQGAEGVDG